MDDETTRSKWKWWHKLFFFLEFLLTILGIEAFVLAQGPPTGIAWWVLLVLLAPAMLVGLVHFIVAWFLNRTSRRRTECPRVGT